MKEPTTKEVLYMFKALTCINAIFFTGVTCLDAYDEYILNETCHFGYYGAILIPFISGLVYVIGIRNARPNSIIKFFLFLIFMAFELFVGFFFSMSIAELCIPMKSHGSWDFNGLEYVFFPFSHGIIFGSVVCIDLFVTWIYHIMKNDK